jgi:hypothetical protein
MAVMAFTMLAGSRQITDIRFRESFAVIQFVDPHPGNTEKFVGFIFAKRNVVFGHTCHHAGAASRALVQIDDHSEPFAFFLFHLYLTASLI